MNRVFACYSGSKYHTTTGKIVTNAPQFGADKVWVYDDAWEQNCRPEFWECTRWLREHPQVRGVNWFAFKPHYILDAYRRLDDGDVLLACDADTYPVADLTPFYEQCVKDKGVLLFNARGCLNKLWTKRDCFLLMGCDLPAYHNAIQTVGRFMLVQKGADFPVEKFLCEWLGHTLSPVGNTFDPSILAPEYDGFRQHRCEQSVLSNLTVTYGLPQYREACEFGWGYPGDVPSETQPNERDCTGRQTFSQHGAHTFRPGFSGDHSEGSAYRNVND